MITRFHQMDGKELCLRPRLGLSWAPNRMEDRRTIQKKKNKTKCPLKILGKSAENSQSWIEVHIKEFKRLEIVGDFENYYSTMSYEAEAQIVRELGKFLLDGSLSRI